MSIGHKATTERGPPAVKCSSQKLPERSGVPQEIDRVVAGHKLQQRTVRPAGGLDGGEVLPPRINTFGQRSAVMVHPVITVDCGEPWQNCLKAGQIRRHCSARMRLPACPEISVRSLPQKLLRRRVGIRQRAAMIFTGHGDPGRLGQGLHLDGKKPLGQHPGGLLRAGDEVQRFSSSAAISAMIRPDVATR